MSETLLSLKEVAEPTEWPRLMTRKDAARYMGRSLRKFDRVKHLFRKKDADGLIRYDRALMDRHIDLLDAA